MKINLFLISLLLIGCSEPWKEEPYEVYWIGGNTYLGYSLGEGAFIGRIDEPKNIESNEKYISVYACPFEICSYFYIDKVKDHKYADHDEFVYGPLTKKQFLSLKSELGLPNVNSN